MITDKTIVNAARDYCNKRYPASQDAPFIAEGFRKGAKWAIDEFLKELWHPAEEEPKGYERQILVQYSYGSSMSLLKVKDILSWEHFTKNMAVKQWYYLDDLTEKGGKK